MCLICADLIRGYMTPKEARRNFQETLQKIDLDHRGEVIELIEINEAEQTKNESKQPLVG